MYRRCVIAHITQQQSHGTRKIVSHSNDMRESTQFWLIRWRCFCHCCLCFCFSNGTISMRNYQHLYLSKSKTTKTNAILASLLRWIYDKRLSKWKLMLLSLSLKAMVLNENNMHCSSILWSFYSICFSDSITAIGNQCHWMNECMNLMNKPKLVT